MKKVVDFLPPWHCRIADNVGYIQCKTFHLSAHSGSCVQFNYRDVCYTLTIMGDVLRFETATHEYCAVGRTVHHRIVWSKK